MEHSLEEKLNVIKMHKQGAGVKLLAKRFGLSRSLITVWLEQYKQHGVAGLQRLPYNCRYNFEEKCHIVCEIEKNMYLCTLLAQSIVLLAPLYVVGDT